MVSTEMQRIVQESICGLEMRACSINYGGGGQRLYTSAADTHLPFCLSAGLAINGNIIPDVLMNMWSHQSR